MSGDESNEMELRKGVIAGGNFVIDFVKMIDHWPKQDTLASIRSQTVSNGGGPYNILKDLVRLSPGIPLEACGLVGQDANGDWILEDCQSEGICIKQLHRIADTPTSYTDVMSEISTGRRTFFHQRGANAKLAESHFDFRLSESKIFFLGYLTLLDSLDQLDDNGSTAASKVLASAKETGMLTAIDCVSAPHPDFKAIVLAALPYADVFFLNEFEMGQILGREVSEHPKTLVDAAVDLASQLNAFSGRIVLHAATGAVVVDNKSNVATQGAVNFPNEQNAGASGAGDAFAAGFLLGIHDGLGMEECLRYAVCVAASSLTKPSPSDGIGTISECLDLGHRLGYREF